MYMPMNGYIPPNGWMTADPHAAYQQQMAAAPMMGQYPGYPMQPQMGQMATTGASYMNGTPASYTMSMGMAPYMPAAAIKPQAGQQGQQGQRGDLRDMISMYLPADQVQDPTRMMAAPPAHVQAVYHQPTTTPPSSEGSSVPLTHM